MPLCPTCGAALDAGARFCPKDGTTIRPDTPAPRRAAAGALFPRDEVGRGARTAAGGDEARSDPRIGAVIDGRYRIQARLGQGGVGAVFAGEHLETRRPVAIKVLHALFAGSEEFHKRFEREARAASKLTHPSCVSVLDFGRVERVEPVAVGPQLLGVPYLVMEFVRGRLLADRLEQPLPPTEAVVIARGVLSALKHAHGLGVVHRDIKPTNIMLVEGGGTGLLVKLLDFGLAKLVDERDSTEPLTQAGMVFGTPGYLSPEQAAGQPADTRSDLYALGVVLYEMVAGRRPFAREDPLDVVRDHLQTPPPPPRSLGAPISAELEAVILRALAKDPAGRWQTAEELSAALAATPELRGEPARPVATAVASPLGTAPTQAAPIVATPTAATAPPRPRRWHAPAWLSRGRARWQAWTRRQRALAVAVAAAAAAVALGAIVLAGGRPPPPPPAPAPSAPTAPPPPVSAEALRHLEQGVGYQRKLWCSDALDELERAVRDAPSLRQDPSLQRAAIACLGPKTRDKAVHFLVERVGPPARDALTKAAAADPNGEVRRGAERALERLPP